MAFKKVWNSSKIIRLRRSAGDDQTRNLLSVRLLLSAPSFLVKSSGYCCIFLTRMCIFARCGCGKIVSGTGEIVCGSMQKYAYSICYLVAPACLVFEQYCYFDGFWLRMLSVQFTACTDGSKRCYCKNIHSNTFSRPFRYLHLLDYPLTFYLVISNKKMHPIPCIDRQLWARSGS